MQVIHEVTCDIRRKSAFSDIFVANFIVKANRHARLCSLIDILHDKGVHISSRGTYFSEIQTTHVEIHAKESVLHEIRALAEDFRKDNEYNQALLLPLVRLV